MAYNLPDGVTQDMIDREIEDDPWNESWEDESCFEEVEVEELPRPGSYLAEDHAYEMAVDMGELDDGGENCG